jgi:hypothetical protein
MTGNHGGSQHSHKSSSYAARPLARPSVLAEADHVFHNHSMICAAAC